MDQAKARDNDSDARGDNYEYTDGDGQGENTVIAGSNVDVDIDVGEEDNEQQQQQQANPNQGPASTAHGQPQGGGVPAPAAPQAQDSQARMLLQQQNLIAQLQRQLRQDSQARLLLQQQNLIAQLQKQLQQQHQRACDAVAVGPNVSNGMSQGGMFERFSYPRPQLPPPLNMSSQESFERTSRGQGPGAASRQGHVGNYGNDLVESSYVKDALREANRLEELALAQRAKARSLALADVLQSHFGGAEEASLPPKDSMNQ